MTETITRVRIELEGTEPLVWRELDLPLSTTLASLHDIIQVVMRWQDYHLHEFEVGDKIYGVPDLDDVFDERKVYKEKSIRLGTLMERGVRDFLYLYDFGDNWQQRIMMGEPRQATRALNTPASSMVRAARPQKTLAGLQGSKISSTLWQTPSTSNSSRCWTGTGRSSTPRTSTPTGSR